MVESTPGTIEIQLTREYIALIDTEDIDLAHVSWCATVRGELVYAKRGVKQPTSATYYLHRVIAERMTGRALQRNERVDHKNGNTLDNRRANLRLSSPAQNSRNSRRRPNASGFKGVRRHKTGRWFAVIRTDGKRLYLGTFDSPEEAHEAYKAAALKYHGEFANFG